MGVATMPARLQALGGEPPPQLGDDAVDRREIGQRPRRQRPIELAERPCGGQAARSLDLRTLSPRSSRARRMRCTSTPITPEPSWRRANAAIAIRARSRIAPSAPSLNAAAIWARRASS